MGRFATGLRSSRQIPARSPAKGEIGGPPAVTRWHGNLDRKRVRERSSRQERVRPASNVRRVHQRATSCIRGGGRGTVPSRPAVAGARRPRGVGRWPHLGLVGGWQPRGGPAPVRTEPVPRRHWTRAVPETGRKGDNLVGQGWPPREPGNGRPWGRGSRPGAGERAKRFQPPSPGRKRFESAPPHVSSDRDKTPEQIQAEARKLLAELKAERQRDAILKDAQNRAEQEG